MRSLRCWTDYFKQPTWTNSLLLGRMLYVFGVIAVKDLRCFLFSGVCPIVSVRIILSVFVQLWCFFGGPALHKRVVQYGTVP